MEDQIQRNRKKKSIIAAVIVTIIVGGFIGVITLLVSVFSIFGGGRTGFGEIAYYDESFNSLDEFEVSRADQRIGYLSFIGEISSEAMSGGNPLTANQGFITPEIVSSRINDLIKSENDLKAIVLGIESPGGAVSPSDELNNIIAGYAKDYPIYVYSGDVLASGGYDMAVPAKKIYTSQEALTGSIGVISQFFNLEELANKAGVSVETFKAGEFKDLGNQFRSFTDAERVIMQELADHTYNAFVANVAEGRDLEEDKVREFANGDIWRGPQALERGLIDGVMYKDELIAQIKQDESIEENVIVVEYAEPPLSFIDSLLGISAKFGSNSIEGVANEILSKKSGFYYLYQGY